MSLLEVSSGIFLMLFYLTYVMGHVARILPGARMKTSNHSVVCSVLPTSMGISS